MTHQRLGGAPALPANQQEQGAEGGDGAGDGRQRRCLVPLPANEIDAGDEQHERRGADEARTEHRCVIRRRSPQS